MYQPHEHRHPHENYSFTFKCLTAVAVTTAVIAVPLLIIPLFMAALLYAFLSNNQQPTVRVNIAREGDLFNGGSVFFRQNHQAPIDPSSQFHHHRENVHHHLQYHDAPHYKPEHVHCSSDLYASHHQHGHR